jgi:hypothetical protein
MAFDLRKAGAAFLFVISGCSLSTDPGTFGTRQPSVIDRGGADSVQITIPATVTVGTAFNVVVTTYGGDCVAQGDTPVAVNGHVAEIRPYDVFQANASSAGCNRNLVLFAHSASVTFLEQGTATVRIFGRKDPGKVDITVERIIQVN